MLEILSDKTICLTRGDVANILIGANLKDKQVYTFRVGDVVRLTVTKKRDYGCILLQKSVTVEAETQAVRIRLEKEDTHFCKPINKPVDYWYEIEVNPDTDPQTIIGYDTMGEKIFRLFPEGGAAE